MDKSKYILGIDDDEDDSSLLGEALQKANPACRLHFIKSGDQAIKYLTEAMQNNDLPGLIVLDINMPAMDGRDTLLEIKKLLADIYIPVLFLTTTPRNEDLFLGESQGITLMAKPRSTKGYDELAKTIFDSVLN